jgi:hypothetical protein
MEDVTRHRAALVARLLEGPGHAPTAHRSAAFHNTDVPEPVRALVDKVARNAWKVTDVDVAAVTSAGVSDDVAFELVVCAAVGQATRQTDSARQLLAAAVAARAGDTR